jgi:endonuclease/exonuclease/phosphatase family metal-dependent hydrolase
MIVAHRVWIGQLAWMSAVAGLPLGQQMDQVAGLRGVETAKLAPLQTFGVTQYRRSLGAGELTQLRLATLNLQTEDETVLSEQELADRRSRQKQALLDAQADLIALQELRATDLPVVLSWLGAGWAYKGGDAVAPERNGFFYRVNRLAVEEIAQLPIPPADYPVISARWQILPEKIRIRTLHAYLPPHDPVKRQKQAEMMAREVRREQGPLVVLGDLSTWPYLPADRRVLYYDGPAILSILRTAGLVDADTRTVFGAIGPTGDLILQAKDGRMPLAIRLAHVLTNSAVEPILSAIQEPAAEAEPERQILVVDLAISVDMPLPPDLD